MTLNRLLANANVVPAEVAGDAELTGMEIDSRRCSPGFLFVCMPNMTRESESFIPDAAAKGAKAALVHSKEGVALAVRHGMAAALVPHTGGPFHDAIWRICDVFFEHPTRDLKVIGVTGTNGKTTTAWLIRDILAGLGLRTAYLGTLGFQLPGEERSIENTTPFTVELYNLLAEAKAKRVEAIAMEVSSHALAEKRADGIEFDAGVFTNFTQDHLDFHETMEAYSEAKHRLFTVLPSLSKKRFVGAFNLDDPKGARWALEQNGPTLTYSLEDGEADLKGTALEIAVDHLTLQMECRGEITVTLPLGGAYNVVNTLSATAGLLACGYSLQELRPALEKVRPVPGRFEAVANQKGIGVLVDYAHTPDALEKLLDSVLALKPRRVITVFGCGGDRDRTKRPKMAKVASERSDVSILTSDNPRTEDPEEILREVAQGLVPGRESVSISDREEAIAHAVTMAELGDVVVIAGKGHENYQIVGRTKHAMDDRLLAKAALERR